MTAQRNELSRDAWLFIVLMNILMGFSQNGDTPKMAIVFFGN